MTLSGHSTLRNKLCSSFAFAVLYHTVKRLSLPLETGEKLLVLLGNVI